MKLYWRMGQQKLFSHYKKVTTSQVRGFITNNPDKPTVYRHM